MSAPASLVAPDFVEAIEAWRVWRVVATRDGFSLRSVIKPTVWPAGEPLVAECLRGSMLATWLRRKRSPMEAPEERCECGIYARRLPDLEEYLTHPPGIARVARVLGQVCLWGTVIECERGYRASNAYPLHLYVPLDADTRHDREELVAGLQRYRVPVEPLSARCSDAAATLQQTL